MAALKCWVSNVLFIAVWGLFILQSAASQHTVPDNSRFRFAQGAIGISLYATVNGQSAFIDDKGLSTPYSFGPQLYPVLHVGGMHFWGRIEFYFNIALGQLLNSNISAANSFHLSQNDLFGLKLYPRQLRQKTLRPFIGGAIGGINFQQKDKDPLSSGVLHSQFVIPIYVGMSFQTQKGIWDLSVKYIHAHKFRYHISPTEVTDVDSPSVSLGLTYKRVWDGTAGNEDYHYSGKESADYKLLRAQKKLNSFFIAAGPSAAIFTRNLSYNTLERPYLDKYVSSNTFIDIGIGYFADEAMSFLGVAYRNYKAQRNAFGTEQAIHRRSVVFELNRYLFDYQGFVPFAGVGVSHEQIQFSESLPDRQTSSRHIQWAFGINIGWDILPTRLEYFTLRTNVRYFPWLNLKLDSSVSTLPQLEVNILQFVFYPQRFKHIRNL